MRPRSSIALAALGVVAMTLTLGPAADRTLARFSDASGVTADMATDTLAPPTSVLATGGATVGLVWTPTLDTYATGYDVYRSSTSGGPYALIDSVSPGTASATADAPGPGTWSYVLRSTFGAWRSSPSVEASATVGGAMTTADVPCATSAADTLGAGDNDGYQTNPSRACARDGLVATDAASGNGGTSSCGAGSVPAVNKDRHRFWGFGLGLPGSVSAVDGITVHAELGMNNNGGTTNLCAQLSGDGGLTWTAIRAVPVAGQAQATYTFGGPGDTWGRSWGLAELTSPAFVVRLIDASTQTNKSFLLDVVTVSVTYRP